MITSIDIENLRGIQSGKLDGLAALTILTGPNACGKSSVLDALLIATSPEPEDAIGQAVERHRTALSGAKWLLGAPSSTARLEVETSWGARWRRSLDWREGCEKALRDRLLELDARRPFSRISLNEKDQHVYGTRMAWTAFGAENRYVVLVKRRGEPAEVPFVRLVDPGDPIALHQQFTAATRTGRRDDVHALLSVLVPQFERLEILVEDDNTPTLNLISAGRSVPVGLAGDGVQAFVQLALEFAVAPEGLVLVEEPETYQHPKAIWQTARVLLANMRRGVQIVLSTHSLELIDALLGEATEDDLEKMALFNLLLEEGELRSARRAGKEIAFARQTLEADLR